MKNSDNIYPYLIFSLVLHLSMFCLSFFHIPFLRNKNIIVENEEQIITFEMLSISDKSNVKDQQRSLEQQSKIEPIKEQVEKTKENIAIVEQKPIIIDDDKIAATKKEINKPNNEQTSSTTNNVEKSVDLKTDTPNKQSAEIDHKPHNNKIMEKADNVTDQLDELIKEELVLEKKSQITPKTPKDKQEDVKNQKSDQTTKIEKQIAKPKISNNNELNSLLKNLEKTADRKKSDIAKHSGNKDANQQEESKGQFDPTVELSISEKNLIRNQIAKHWQQPLAVQGQEDVLITVKVNLGKDGEVLEAEVIKRSCDHTSRSICQIMADRAKRAVLQASPIVNLNIQNQRELELNFGAQGIQ